MGQEIYVFDSVLTTRISLSRDGYLDMLSIEAKNASSLVEGVYLGKITKVIPGIDAAFIDCGMQKDAFLNLEAETERTNIVGQKHDKDRLTEGSRILVQVKSDERDGKGPRVSGVISLVGRCAVFSPYSGTISVSRRITDSSERARLDMVASRNRKGNEGILVRTAAGGQSGDEISHEIAKLRKIWADIKKRKGLAESIGLLWPAPTAAERFLRDHLNAEVVSIMVSDRNKVDEVKGYCKAYYPQAVGLVEALTGERAMMAEDNFEEQLEGVSASVVRLPSGGRLYFDETRSMTTVDVDTGENNSKGRRSGIAFQTNLEAASIMGRQLRLRNIGGLIVIDFVSMRHRNDKKRVLNALKLSLNEDNFPVRISDFSEFGVVELTRYRRGRTHSSVMREVCSNCNGDGKVRNIRAVIDQIFVALGREIFFSQGNSFSIVSNERTIGFMRTYCLDIIDEIERNRAVRINLMVDHDDGCVDFRIVSG
tara:strand:- start:1672 stop:3117 length:1446 start_codon:yes stop_codon:yes gene_type:complete